MHVIVRRSCHYSLFMLIISSSILLLQIICYYYYYVIIIIIFSFSYDLGTTVRGRKDLMILFPRTPPLIVQRRTS